MSAKVKDATLLDAVMKVTEGQPVKVKVKGTTLFVQYQKRKDRKIGLWGHVKDAFTKVGIPNVHITLMRSDYTVIDTTTVNYRWSGASRMASYRFEVPAVEADYVVLAQHPDYEDCYIDYPCRHIVRNTFFDMPDHLMNRKKKNAIDGGELGEVEVKATRVQFMFRGDTLVYNADAFNIPEGSMLDGLIRQLPGAELTRDGEIYVNGRKIDNLLLNGKDFLKGNNKVLLENLPYYTVKELKVYDRETELNKYLGYDKEQKEYVMDVGLKREYQHSGMGNVLVGAGTDGRYKEQLFGLFNAEHSRYGLAASMNNISEQASPSNNGIRDTFDPKGETKQVGFTLPAIWGNRQGTLSNALAVTTHWDEVDNRSRTLTENYLSSGNTFLHDVSAQREKRFSFRFTEQFEMKAPFFLRSILQLDTRHYTTNGVSETLLAADEGLTDSVNHTSIRNRDKTSELNLSWENHANLKLSTGDDVDVSLTGTLQHLTWRHHAQNQYRYFKTAEEDFRRRFDRLPSTRWNLEGSITYSIRFPNRFEVAPVYTLQASHRRNENNYYRLDRLEESAHLHPFGWLPQTADSLLFALDLDNTNASTVTEQAHNIGVNLFYDIETSKGRLYKLQLDLIPVFKHRSLDYQTYHAPTVGTPSLPTTGTGWEEELLHRSGNDWTYWLALYYNESKNKAYVSNARFTRPAPDHRHPQHHQSPPCAAGQPEPEALHHLQGVHQPQLDPPPGPHA